MPRSMYPSIFNLFPVIQAGSLKIRHFSTFLHILASPVYAPGTIAVNVTRIEREFNACQMPRSMYPSIFYRFRGIATYWSKIATFLTPHLCLAAPQGVTPSEFGEDLDIHKTRMNGLSCGEESMTICSAVLIQYGQTFVTQTFVWRTNGQTDGRTDVQPISITGFSTADARKNVVSRFIRSKVMEGPRLLRESFITR